MPFTDNDFLKKTASNNRRSLTLARKKRAAAEQEWAAKRIAEARVQRERKREREREAVKDIQIRFVKRIGRELEREFSGIARSRNLKIAGKKARFWRSPGDGARAIKAEVHVIKGHHTKQELRAWTDFSQLHLEINSQMAPHYSRQRDEVRPWMRRLKAALVHELGHAQFTIPQFMLIAKGDLWKISEEAATGWTWGYSTVEPKHRAMVTYERLTDWRVCARDLQQPWNVLEDQRMESAVVRHYPWAKGYLIPLVVNLIVEESPESAWTLVAGRTYLPKEVREAARANFNKWFEESASDEARQVLVPNGEDPADQWKALVDEYKTATTIKGILDATIKAAEVLKTLPFEYEDSSHESGQSRGYGEEADEDEMSKRLKEGAKNEGDEGDKGGSGSEEDDEGEDEEEGSGSGEDDEDDSSSEADERPDPDMFSRPEADGGEGEADPNFGEEQWEDILEQYSEFGDLLDTEEAEADTIRDAILDATTGSLQEFVADTEDLPADFQTKAYAITTGIERALQTFVTENEPSWRNRQETGVLDPIAYRTKQVGEIDYRRHLDGGALTGMDVHVSILCDVSGSMDANMGALSASILSMTQACVSVGCNYDVTLWSDNENTFTLNNQEALEPRLYPTLGGTEPLAALDALNDVELEGEGHHLVIIFTDGEWFGGGWNLQDWKEHDGDAERHFFLAKYGSWGSSYGADKVVTLHDILDLPRLMEEGLQELL